jgi:hypothetical protein
MSHFVTLVFGPNPEEQLSRFDEEKHSVFMDDEDEYLEDFNKNTVNMVIFADGQKFTKYDREMEKYWKRAGIGISSQDTFIPPKEAEIKTMPVKEVYSSFEDYMLRRHEMERDPAHNRYGHYVNPEAKWDWYDIGGRYKGYLVLQKGWEAEARKKADFISEPNGNYEEYADLRANRTLSKYVDWEKTLEKYAPFAVLLNEQWHERGSMGWWGAVADSKEPADWQKEVISLLKNVPGDTLVTVYDLHI